MIRVLLFLLCCAVSADGKIAPADPQLYEFQNDDVSLVLQTLARQVASKS